MYDVDLDLTIKVFYAICAISALLIALKVMQSNRSSIKAKEHISSNNPLPEVVVKKVPLEVIYTGGTVTIAVSGYTKCSSCLDGMRYHQYSTEVCPICGGSGAMFEAAVADVPVGTQFREGTEIVVPGSEFVPPLVSPPGVRVQFALQENKKFSIQGAELHCVCWVTSDLLCAGGELALTLPSGVRLAVNVPPKSRDGTVLLLPRRGLLIQGNERSPMKVTLRLADHHGSSTEISSNDKERAIAERDAARRREQRKFRLNLPE